MRRTRKRAEEEERADSNSVAVGRSGIARDSKEGGRPDRTGGSDAGGGSRRHADVLARNDGVWAGHRRAANWRELARDFPAIAGRGAMAAGESSHHRTEQRDNSRVGCVPEFPVDFHGGRAASRDQRAISGFTRRVARSSRRRATESVRAAATRDRPSKRHSGRGSHYRHTDNVYAGRVREEIPGGKSLRGCWKQSCTRSGNLTRRSRRAQREQRRRELVRKTKKKPKQETHTSGLTRGSLQVSRVTEVRNKRSNGP